MLAVAQPPIIAPAPIASRNVMVWGDQAAMDAMRRSFEAKNWKWVTMSLGGQTPALLLIPPPNVSENEITQLVNDVNAGKYGKLNGGYAKLGSPNDENGSTLS